jgi:hypothetical protein
VVRTVIVRDTQKPVITITGGNTVYVNVFSAFTPPSALVTDNYDIGLSYTVTGNPVNTAVVGTYLLYYNAVDNSGNAATTQTLTVYVRDVTAPKLTLFLDDTTMIDVGTLTKVPEPGYSITDNYYPSGAIMLSVDYSAVNLNVLGVYTVRYYISDPSGNADSSKVRIYKVVDRTAPVITLNGSAYMTWPRWKPFVDPGATVTDNYYTGLVANADMSKLNIYLDGVYEIRYSVTDPSGNKATDVSRFVEVKTSANGIDHQAGLDEFNVYPNPSNGMVNIALDIKDRSTAKITIYDANGKAIYNVSGVSSMHNILQVDLQSKAAGLYWIKVEAGDYKAVRTISLQR